MYAYYSSSCGAGSTGGAAMVAGRSAVGGVGDGGTLDAGPFAPTNPNHAAQPLSANEVAAAVSSTKTGVTIAAGGA